MRRGAVGGSASLGGVSLVHPRVPLGVNLVCPYALPGIFDSHRHVESSDSERLTPRSPPLSVSGQRALPHYLRIGSSHRHFAYEFSLGTGVRCTVDAKGLGGGSVISHHTTWPYLSPVEKSYREHSNIAFDDSRPLILTRRPEE